ncbi:MAG: hypothetical protein KBT27_11450 [Prevotellaceae bacterium]|nr:hypothetical protein [Candidatus Faecinaster equi]
MNALLSNYKSFETSGTNTIESYFDSSKLSSLTTNRNARFHLDLCNSTLIQVLEASETFHKKQNPRYKNSAIVGFINRLETAIGATIMPIDVTDEFYVEAQSFLLNVPNEKGKIVKPSTITNYFSIIQGTLSWASKHNCKISETYNVWKVDHYEKPKIALTPSMIAYIYSYDISQNAKKLRAEAKAMKVRNFSLTMLERIRDQFVIECQLGQRYSDASRFDRTNFDASGTVFRITQQKTGGKAVVNLSKYAIDKTIAFKLLRKYDYKSPAHGFDISNANKYLHLLCKCIGGDFSEIVGGENKISGTIHKEEYKVWQLITTHTARRTFITYWANSNDMSIVRLQKCTGHKDVRQISRYTIMSETD